MNINLIYKKFGRRLRDARKAAELTQEALADRVGLSRTSITNIEKGRQRIPLHALFLLAPAVGVPPPALLPEREETHTSDVIDKRLLKKTPLKQDQMDYVTTLVTSGMIRKKEQDDNQHE